MYRKKILLLLVLVLTLLNGTGAATEELNVAVIDSTAIPFAKEDHLTYGIVKMWNKADTPVVTTLSITPNRNHHLDDNRYWGNYKTVENIKIGANELHIQIFCFTIPANSNMGKQTWTLNISTGEQVITKEVTINLPVTKNVQVNAPIWQPDILKLEFPPAKSNTIAVEASKPKVILAMLKMAGDLSDAKVYDVELKTTLPDIFFFYPEKITVEISKPKSWDFDNQTFLPFTVIPVPLLTIDVPYSSNENMYELKLQMEEKGTGLKADLPFQLVVTTPAETPKTVKTGVIRENMTAVNETVNNSEIATVTETIVVINLSKIAKPIDMLETEKTNNRWTWSWSEIDQLNDRMWNFIISKIQNLQLEQNKS